MLGVWSGGTRMQWPITHTLTKASPLIAACNWACQAAPSGPDRPPGKYTIVARARWVQGFRVRPCRLFAPSMQVAGTSTALTNCNATVWTVPPVGIRCPCSTAGDVGLEDIEGWRLGKCVFIAYQALGVIDCSG
jgi:hypothetical protein